MAQKTPTELAREVQEELKVLRTEFGSVRTELDRTDLPRLRERLAVLEQKVTDLNVTRDEAKRIAVVENQLTDLRRWQEESGRRLFQFMLLFVGGIVTLAINLVVTFLRK